MSSYTPIVDFSTRASILAYPNIFPVNKFGRNFDLDTGAAELVWTKGGLYTFPSAADTLDIFSGSASDDNTPPGVGAQSIRIQGLDGSDAYLEEDIDLNGVSTVTTVGSFKRVSRVFVLSAGTSFNNVGLITIQTNTGGNVLAEIRASVGQTEMALYSVATGKAAILRYVELGILGTSNAEVTFEIYLNDANGVTRIQDSRSLDKSVQLTMTRAYEFGPLYEGPCDLYMQAASTANNMDVKASFDLLVIDA